MATLEEDLQLVRDCMRGKPATYAALDRLEARARAIGDAVARVQRIRDEHAADYTEDEAELLDSETFGRHFGRLDAFAQVLDVLQILAHGLTPAQGGEPS